MGDLVERPALRWGDLGIRIASALVLAPLALACIWLGGVTFVLLVAAAALGLATECVMLCRRSTWPARVLLCPAGLAYVGLAAAALLWLRLDPFAGRANMLFLVLIVWGSDVGAYLIGRLLGGPRFAPRISPSKTWSGAIGGLLAAVAVGLLTAQLLSDAPSPGRVVVLASILGVMAQAGDLLESFVKRRLQIKDTSHLIPGHGGLFDRLDAILATAPVAALLALSLGRGVVLWQ